MNHLSAFAGLRPPEEESSPPFASFPRHPSGGVAGRRGLPPGVLREELPPFAGFPQVSLQESQVSVEIEESCLAIYILLWLSVSHFHVQCDKIKECTYFAESFRMDASTGFVSLHPL